jgi:hypothetical protein
MDKKIILLLIIILILSCNILRPKKSARTAQSKELSNESIYDSTYIEELDSYVGIGSGSIVGSSRTIESTTSENTQNESVQTTEVKKEFGQIVYKIPDTMIVLKSYEIVIRISKGQKVNIEENLNGRITKKEIRVESRMEVKLKDPESKFEISEINKERQLIEEDEFTEWRFVVIPKKTGKCKLNLVVSIIIGEDTKEIVYEDIITVRSNPTVQVKSWWEENWKLMLELILIPLFIWGYNKWKNRKK